MTDDEGHGAAQKRRGAWSPPPRGRCGARTRAGGECAKQAGWGTPDRRTTGPCRLHGGATRSHRTAAGLAAARQAVITYGLPRDIDPRDALLEEVHRTAGHIAWLGERVAAHTPAQLVGLADDPDEDGGPGVSRWLVLYQRERRHLREVARDAIAAGIEERRVKLAEEQGVLLAAAVRGILGDLNLSAEQWGLVPEVVPRHLRAVADRLDDDESAG
jgi:hypothetical protein